MSVYGKHFTVIMDREKPSFTDLCGGEENFKKMVIKAATEANADQRKMMERHKKTMESKKKGI